MKMGSLTGKGALRVALVIAVLAISQLGCGVCGIKPPGGADVATPSAAPPTPTAAPPAATATPLPPPTAPPAPAPTPAADATADSASSGQPRSVLAIDELLPGNVIYLSHTPDGALWLATDEGVARMRDDAWEVHVSGLPGMLLGVDETSRVWVLSEDASAISAWDGAAWTVYGPDEGWTAVTSWASSQVGQGVLTDAAGRVWLATAQDVRVLEGERWTVVTPGEMGMAASEYEDTFLHFDIALLGQGDELWVGACELAGPGPIGGQGARWFDGQSWQGGDSPVASGCASAITEDPAGNVWLGLDADLWRYERASGDWTRLSPPGPAAEEGVQRYGSVLAIVFDAAGDPWAGLVTCGGASCGGEVYFHVRDGDWVAVADETFYGSWIIAGGAGRPWLFTWEGDAYQVEGDALELQAQMDAQIVGVVVDSAGRPWFVTRAGDRQTLWVID